MVFEHRDYRTYLRAVLAERKARNASYSQSAFAKALAISPSLLSDILRGSKNISFESAVQIAERLGLGPDEGEYFTALVQLGSISQGPAKNVLERKLDSIRGRTGHHNLGVDAFKLIAEWYHLPILELFDLDPETIGEINPGLISQRFGISAIEAQAALERLERLELLERGTDGRLRKVHENTLTESRPPNSALRSYHQQLLKKAGDALETQTNDEKFVGSEVLAIDETLLPEAARRFDQFLMEMAEFLKGNGKKTQVYCLGAQFFNLMKKEGVAK